MRLARVIVSPQSNVSRIKIKVCSKVPHVRLASCKLQADIKTLKVVVRWQAFECRFFDTAVCWRFSVAFWCRRLAVVGVVGYFITQDYSASSKNKHEMNLSMGVHNERLLRVATR